MCGRWSRHHFLNTKSHAPRSARPRKLGWPPASAPHRKEWTVLAMPHDPTAVPETRSTAEIGSEKHQTEGSPKLSMDGPSLRQETFCHVQCKMVSSFSPTCNKLPSGCCKRMGPLALSTSFQPGSTCFCIRLEPIQLESIRLNFLPAVNHQKSCFAALRLCPTLQA